MPDDYQTQPTPRVRPEGGRHRLRNKPRKRPSGAAVASGWVFVTAAAFVVALATNSIPTVGVQQLADDPPPVISSVPTPVPAYLDETAPPTTAPPTTTAPTTTIAPAPTTTQASKPKPTAKPKPVETTRAPAKQQSSSAAAKFGWGPVVAGDEFNSGSKPGSKWSMYDGPGHDDQGRRTPSAFTVNDGMLRVHGDAKGNTGGMAYKDGQLRGRWEARMRVPRGDSQYHPVLILWPDAEDFPEGGEIDYAETGAASNEIEFFLHYGEDNSQTSGSAKVDLSVWHNYAVEWTSKCITGYVDAVRFFQDCNTSHLPPRAMHMTIQLDYFPKGGSPKPTDMYIDWIRQYQL